MSVLEQPIDQTDLLDCLPVAVAVFDADVRLISYNSAYVSLWGLTAEWLDSAPSLGAILDELRDARRLPEQVDYKGYRAAEISKLTPPVSVSADTAHLPDGASLIVSIVPSPAGGSVVCYRDTTAMLAAERALKEVQSVQRTTLDHLQDGVAVFDPGGGLKYANGALTALWRLSEDITRQGWRLGDFLDATRTVLPVTPDWPAVRQRLTGRLTSRKSGRDRLRLNDGRVLDGGHIPLPDGGTLLHYRDVTDSVRIEDELREQSETATAESRLKSAFLATLSHELRTPLTTVSGFAELLAGEYFGPLMSRQREYVDGITETAQAIKDLIADTMELSSIDAGQAQLALESFDLHPELVNLLREAEHRARERKITLAFDCPPDIGWLAADKGRIHRALTYLMNNALILTGSGGIITLGAARDPERITVTVRDTGAGLPKEDLAALDEGGALAEDRPLSAGLGLMVVKRICKIHGGAFEIESRLNRGTTARIILPAATEGAS